MSDVDQSLIGLPYVFWFGTGQCRCSSKVPSRLPTLSLVEGRKRTDTSLIPMGLDCVCGRCGHWNKLGENYYMKKEKERENCPSQGGISSKINSCRGDRLKSVCVPLPVNFKSSVPKAAKTVKICSRTNWTPSSMLEGQRCQVLANLVHYSLETRGLTG